MTSYDKLELKCNWSWKVPHWTQSPAYNDADVSEQQWQDYHVHWCRVQTVVSASYVETWRAAATQLGMDCGCRAAGAYECEDGDRSQHRDTTSPTDAPHHIQLQSYILVLFLAQTAKTMWDQLKCYNKNETKQLEYNVQKWLAKDKCFEQ